MAIEVILKMSSDTCIFCKGTETPDNTFAVKTDDCLCKLTVHDGCLFKLNGFLSSNLDKSIKTLIEKYITDKYSLCRTCKHTKYQISVKSDIKIGVKTYCLYETSQISVYPYNKNYIQYKFKTLNHSDKDKFRHFETYVLDYGNNYDPFVTCDYYEDDNYREHGLYIQRSDSYPHNIVKKCTYKHGRKHGEYYEYYSNGRISEGGNYLNGERHGIYISYFNDDNNSKRIESLYNNGNRYGYEKRYLSNGTLIKEIFYNNHIVSYEQPYRKYNDNGKLILEISLIEALQYQRTPSGILRTYELVTYKEYNIDGSIKLECKKYYYRGSSGSVFVEHDIPTVKYHSNGKIQMQKTFIDSGESQGYNRLVLVETFYATSAKHERYTIKHDPCATMEGPYISWHPDGKYKKICEYRDNELINQCGVWNSEGTIVLFGKYSADGEFKAIQLGI